jgi:hypothetical protein
MKIKRKKQMAFVQESRGWGEGFAGRRVRVAFLALVLLLATMLGGCSGTISAKSFDTFMTKQAFVVTTPDDGANATTVAEKIGMKSYASYKQEDVSVRIYVMKKKDGAQELLDRMLAAYDNLPDDVEEEALENGARVVKSQALCIIGKTYGKTVILISGLTPDEEHMLYVLDLIEEEYAE